MVKTKIFQYLIIPEALEALKNIPNAGLIRLNSFALKQSNFDFLIQELPYDLLIKAVMGFEILLITMTKEPEPYINFFEFLKYTLNKYYLKLEQIPIVNKRTKEKIFSRKYSELFPRTFERLNYCKKYIKELPEKCVVEVINYKPSLKNKKTIIDLGTLMEKHFDSYK